MRSLEDYREIVGDETIGEIYRKARGLYGRRVLHINSTYQGGGVAEMLSSLVPLFNDIGIDAGWRILHGSPDFFTITKKFHNALQGSNINLTEIKKKIYEETNENFSIFTHIDHDLVVIHDPQPLPIIRFYKKRQPWVWRCHVDLSEPNQLLWNYMKKFILRYDLAVVSNRTYIKKDLPVEQKVIYPAIDPLSAKNKELPNSLIEKTLRKFKIPLDKPLVTQISRYDRWKDPEGVIAIFKKVKKKVDCRLVMCGNMAPDDPEGQGIYERAKKKAGRFLESGDIIFINQTNDILVNVLQRVSRVIVQKSTKEGFGLSVTEALWKGTPVVASRVGGIPLQVIDEKTGYLLDPDDEEGFAEKIVLLIKDEKLRRKMGEAGREHVRKNFLITRLLKDHLDMLNYLLGQ